jgi:excisionase family DNA binding protein
MADTIDRAALKAILLLAAEGAATTNARMAERTAEVWSILARFATAPGSATISLTGADSFPAPSGEWVSVAEAAELLSVSRGHVRRLCRQGAIRCRRHGERVWLVAADAITNREKAA